MTKKGFDKEFHKRILLQILVEIFKSIDSKVALKGGTCAYLFYNLPRISVDLDFDILKPLNPEDIENIKKILSKFGEIRDFHKKRNTIFFLLNYGEGYPNIKIEFNRRVWKNNKYKIIWFLGIEMKIADETTIFTNKLVALGDRKNPVARDVFDVYYFLKTGFSLNEELIRERTGKNLNEFLTFLSTYIKKKFSKKNILLGLGEVLEEKQKEWIRQNLINEVLELIKSYIKK